MSEATGSLINRRIRYATPVIMGAACVTCHNAHPESPKHDWKIGDIRGIQAITVEQPIAAHIQSFNFLLAYMIGAGGAVLVLVFLHARQAPAMSPRNTERGATN